jgi:hypothetical protein
VIAEQLARSAPPASPCAGLRNQIVRWHVAADIWRQAKGLTWFSPGQSVLAAARG